MARTGWRGRWRRLRYEANISIFHYTIRIHNPILEGDRDQGSRRCLSSQYCVRRCAAPSTQGTSSSARSRSQCCATARVMRPAPSSACPASSICSSSCCYLARAGARGSDAGPSNGITSCMQILTSRPGYPGTTAAVN